MYTAVPEGTFFDRSAYASFSPAVPANNHPNVALSLSKHSTYTFNPSGYPITPAWFIVSCNASLFALYEDGAIDDSELYLSEAIGDNVFMDALSSYGQTREAATQTLERMSANLLTPSMEALYSG